MTEVIEHVDRLRGRYVVNSETGCWDWQGALNYDGYGHIKIDGQQWRAHRASYTLLIGPIPDGLVIDHLCRNRACVNPAHLEPVTNEENILRGDGTVARAARTGACANGHPLIESNLYILSDRSRCRTCEVERMRRARVGKTQAGLTFTCPICNEQRHSNGRRRHLATHGVQA